MLTRIDSQTISRIEDYLSPEHWRRGSDTSSDPFFLCLGSESQFFYKNELYTFLAQQFALGLIPDGADVALDNVMHVLSARFQASRGDLARLAQLLLRIRRSRNQMRRGRDELLTDEAVLELLDRCAARCSICRFQFSDAAIDALLQRERMTPVRRFGYYDRLKPSRRSGMDLSIHVDHIQPISFIGSNDLSNLQLLCSYCNNVKREFLTVFDRGQALLRTTKEPHPFAVLKLMCRFGCAKCETEGAGAEELTVYLRSSDLPATIDNLAVTCARAEHDPWRARWAKVDTTA